MNKIQSFKMTLKKSLNKKRVLNSTAGARFPWGDR